uniref:Uncharacterized protein n=1 Tax=Trichobilharzia regenti TaxID=157069 RepID=A0AA85J242_TRIRE|nr:unnamed protein product [Trichobilharzia regenti]
MLMSNSITELLITCLIHASVGQMQFQQPYIMNDIQDSRDTSSSSPRSLKNANISSYLWHLFQSRNQHFRQMHKPVLYYTSNNDDNNNNNTTWRALNNSDIFNHNHNNNNNIKNISQVMILFKHWKM